MGPSSCIRASVCVSVTFFLRGNNSALGGHRALPKVANERYCNIVLIFGVGIAGTGTGTSKRFLKKKKKMFFFWSRSGAAQRCSHGGGAARHHARLGPEGPHRVQHGSGGPKGPIVYSAPAPRRGAPSCTAHQPTA